MADGDFTQDDFDKILKLLHTRLTLGLSPVAQPTAFLLGRLVQEKADCNRFCQKNVSIMWLS